MEENGENLDNDWRPPTEAEQKVLLARRERSDKISKRMSEYLLKGNFTKVFARYYDIVQNNRSTSYSRNDFEMVFIPFQGTKC